MKRAIEYLHRFPQKIEPDPNLWKSDLRLLLPQLKQAVILSAAEEVNQILRNGLEGHTGPNFPCSPWEGDPFKDINENFRLIYGEWYE